MSTSCAVGRQRQHHALHGAGVAVADAEIGRERHDGHRIAEYLSAGEYRTHPVAQRLSFTCHMDKTVASADEAVADLFDGATMMAGGFGLCGIPEN